VPTDEEQGVGHWGLFFGAGLEIGDQADHQSVGEAYACEHVSWRLVLLRIKLGGKG
jgi:hypothetical protein